jgi:cation-transporting ATPase 13A3/4/5
VPSSGDGIFGDSSRGGDFEPKDFPSSTVPSRQTILLPDEDLSIRFIGYRTDPFRNILWWIGCFLTFGILGLIGRWVPNVWVKFCGKEVAFDEAKEGSWLVVEVSQT